MASQCVNAAATFGPPDGEQPYFDMHCHLDFAPNAQEAVAELVRLGAGAFAVSVLPGNQQESPNLVQSDSSLVRWGVGLHPWWVASGHAGEAELEILLAHIEHNTYVGEVGLDFGRTHGGTAADQQRQAQAFKRITAACAQVGGRVLSIHAVASAADVLHILAEAGTLRTCTCIFHWYSGDSETLHAAIQAGCYFSVGRFMLETKRGREYARQIPAGQLLLETDYPPQGEPYMVDAMQQQLAQTCTAIAQLRKLDEANLAACIAENSRALLQF